MKNFLKVVQNTTDHENKITTAGDISEQKFSKHKKILIAYKMGGFWFCMPRAMWSKYCGVEYNTLCGRQKAGRPPAQIFGYEKFKRYARKKKQNTV